jgi:hypothetical protein
MGQLILKRIITENPDNDPEYHQRLDKEFWWSANNIKIPEMYLEANVIALAAEGVSRGELIKEWEQFYKLHKLLISIGGYQTCFPDIEEDMGKILERGRFWPGRSKMMVGRPSQCHSNASELWDLNHTDHDVRICTGYALSSDGMWRQHSWLTHYYETTYQKRCRLIETTVKRVAYYGYEMTDEEAYEFVENNL